MSSTSSCIPKLEWGAAYIVWQVLAGSVFWYPDGLKNNIGSHLKLCFIYGEILRDHTCEGAFLDTAYISTLLFMMIIYTIFFAVYVKRFF